MITTPLGLQKKRRVYFGCEAAVQAAIVTQEK
jgi:hypothetical protein